MGGTRLESINGPGNLLTLCGDGVNLCHGWVESHPRWAELHGWSVRRGHHGHAPTPEQVPVWTWRGWVLLLHGGDLEPLPDHPGVDGCTCGCQPLPPAPADLWATPEYR